MENLELSKGILQLRIQDKKEEATEKIVEFILENNHIYTTREDSSPEVWIYNEGIYVPQGRTYIIEICRKMLGEAFTTHFCNQVIAKIEADTYIDAKEFYRNNITDEIPVENGILNIHTRELKPFTPDKIFFNKLPIKYDLEKNCPAIKNHFETVLKDKEDVLVLQELAGYLLLKDYKIEKAFMFNGSGRNGKGKSLELLKRFIGAENCCSTPIQLLEEDKFAISELFGKMANLAGDISPTALNNTGRFKEATGRDLITAPRKFLPPIYFINYAKMIFAANELPSTRDITPAFWHRWVYLEFPYQFLTQKEIDALSEEEKKLTKLVDPDHINKIVTSDELSGMLNWALDGLQRLLAQKDFSHTKTAKETEKIWFRKSNSINAFLTDCIELDQQEFIPKSEFKRKYISYCNKYQLRVGNDKTIKEFVTQFGASDEQRLVKNSDCFSNQKHCWASIKFKKEEDN